MIKNLSKDERNKIIREFFYIYGTAPNERMIKEYMTYRADKTLIIQYLFKRKIIRKKRNYI